jgi:dipeptidyl-peptidase-4
MEETQLTTDGADGSIINGTSDWVYEEEFGLRDGWSWSPDGQYLAFFQFDEADTRPFQMADLRGQYPDVTTFRYPKAGEANSEIRVGVIDVATKAKRFFDTGTWNAGGDSLEYIPQMGWTPPIDGVAHVWMFRLNRDQNDLDLLYGNPADGSLRVALQEQTDAWLDVETGFSDLDVGTITYLDDGAHFVWISGRDGYRHLYLYRNDGTLVRQLTSGSWDVTEFHGVDEARGMLYFTATLESPLERHLYRQAFAAGTNGQGSPVKITEQPGWHNVNLSRDLRYYIDTYSNSTTPPVVRLHGIDGAMLELLESNERLIETLAKYDLPAVEFMTVPGADGTSLNAYLIKPKDFDPSRAYPLLLHVYGGPGSQEVRNSWGGTERLWHILLAQQHGVLVAGVDNRGTGGRGQDFLTATYKRLGILEAEDHIAAARYFGQQAYVDAGRIGIWGWSYGGYMTLLSMLYDAGPETFTLGIAVAPVTDWRQYDTIYTERYLSTPQRNPEGYDRGAPVHYADRLRDDQALLIVHGDLDDNVHFQNAIQIVDALQEANKQFDFMVYPGRNHSIAGGNARLHLYTLMTDFIKENL